MNSEKLEHFRQLLLTELRQHTEHLREDQAAALELSDDGVKDSLDFSVMDLNKDLALTLGDRESQMIADIDQALLRIREGSYGVCADCGVHIPRERLLAQPMAIRCASCQATAERGQRR